MGTGKTYSTKYLLDSNNSSGVAGQVLSTTSTGIDWADANTLPGAGLWLESGNDIYNSNSGNVGIGVTNPGAKLDVSSDIRTATRYLISTGTTNENMAIGYWDGVNARIEAGAALPMLITSYQGNIRLGISGGTTMTVQSTNVGIGTTSPGAKLDVSATSNATIRLSSSSANQQGQAIGKIDFYSADTSTPGAGVKSSITTYVESESSTEGDASSMAFSTSNGAVNNVERVRIDKNGNVGIGTTTPRSALDVTGTTGLTWNAATLDSSGLVTIGTRGTGGSLFINTPSINTDWSAGLGVDGSYSSNISTVNIKAFGPKLASGALQGSNLTFSTTYETTLSERMRIDRNGNVGIGTTSPGFKLQVGDNGVADGNIAMKANLTGADAGAKLTFNMNVGGGNADSYIAQIVPISYDSLSSGTHNSLNFKVGTWNNNADAGVSRMTILSNGKVGIGTTNPLRKLDLIADLSTDAVRIKNTNSNGGGLSVFAANGGGGTNRILTLGDSSENIKVAVIENGNVGIGTTSPGEKLEVDGGSLKVSNAYATVKIIGTGGLSRVFLGDTADEDVGYLEYNHISNYFRVGVNAAERMRIDSAGNVGIGTTSPDHKLDVTGDIYSSGQMLTKGAAMACFTVLGDLDTGLGNFNTLGRVSLVSNNKPSITVNGDKVAFDGYIATAVATTGSLNANQSQQALTSDTLAVLAVDPTGNIVRGSQEGTWTFTKAQLDALTTSTTSGTTLIAAPGANKAIIVEESNLMIKYSGTGTMSSNSFVIRQAHNGDATAEITRLPSGQINTIMSSAPANPSYGFYSRDLPLYNNDGRSFVTNKATFLSRISTNATPTNLVSISIKLKYRIFNATTF